MKMADCFCSAGFVSGLLLVAIGTGGIKPCVVTYGGDQFVEGQVKFKKALHKANAER